MSIGLSAFNSRLSLERVERSGDGPLGILEDFTSGVKYEEAVVESVGMEEEIGE